jgi:poly-gamma-glutamate synthesis protein (capsule biosynthesis protein)
MGKLKKRLKSKIINAFILVLIIALGITIGYFGSEKLNFKRIFVKTDYKVVNTKKEYKASIIMAGDALIHASVYAAAYSNNKYDFKQMFENIKPIIKKYDLAYYNQETVLGGASLGLSTYPQFNSPQEVGEALVDAGFNLVSLANNHTLDNLYIKGTKPLENSNLFWSKQKDVYSTGAFLSVEEREKEKIKEVNGISYAFLSYTTSTNGIPIPSGKDYLVNVYSESKAKKDIEKYRDKVDVIIVSMHWGEEYVSNPVESQKTIAKFLADQGVNIIIGTHPHVIQPITYIGDTLVVYSLGNLISSQIGIERLTGLLASATIKKVVYKGVTTITIEEPMGELIFTDKKNKFKLYPYSKLNNDILYGYKSYYETYSKIVTSMDTRVKMVGLD